MEHDAFVRLMQTIADSWNAGGTERALACLADDAVYMEPPDEQRYEGRAELHGFFGAEVLRRCTWSGTTSSSTTT